MKIRTLSELQDVLDKDRSWRLKEIADLKLAVQGSNSLQQGTLIRAGVTLLYAHWEGFIKNAAEGYILFISSKRLKYEQLTSNLIALGVRGKIEVLKSSKSVGINTEVVDFFMSGLAERASLSFAGAIRTESNLSSTVFENIANSVGVDCSLYQTKYVLIDESLLNRRNRIAHGEYLDIDAKAFRVLADEVLDLITSFKTDIENSANLSKFLRT